LLHYGETGNLCLSKTKSSKTTSLTINEVSIKSKAPRGNKYDDTIQACRLTIWVCAFFKRKLAEDFCGAYAKSIFQHKQESESIHTETGMSGIKTFDIKNRDKNWKTVRNSKFQGQPWGC